MVIDVKPPAIITATSSRLSPFIKWAGGKELELVHILPNIPKDFFRYYEPFVGGGAVYFTIDKQEMYINDLSEELIALYRAVGSNDLDFFTTLERIISQWKQIEGFSIAHQVELEKLFKRHYYREISLAELENEIINFISTQSLCLLNYVKDVTDYGCDNFLLEMKRNLLSKLVRMATISEKKGELPSSEIAQNIESAIKSAYYMHYRFLYNFRNDNILSINEKTAVFFFIREFCYASMFRYNSSGKFNVPYGGIQYNRKDIMKKVSAMKSEKYVSYISRTNLTSMDFEDFFKIFPPKQDDFIFLDPPYDSDFSTYSQNSFTKDDQIRLARFLYSCPAKFLLVIKNTDFIYNLYRDKGLCISDFYKKYLVSFQDRNNKNAQHLIITNYHRNSV